jgi:hypothetical protein
LNASSTPEIEAPIPEIEVKKDPNFRTINVGGVFGGPLDTRFEITIFSQHYEASKALASGQQTNDPLKLSRTLECRFVIDPFNLKLIVHWLMGQINAFEKQYGHILTAEERIAASTEAEDKKKTTGVGSMIQ